MSAQFDYDLAFSRNIGWFTEAEQAVIQAKRVAIAGLGGVGGAHTLTLVRLGVTKFHLSDFDSFACENTNRQVGANINTYGVPKLDAIIEMAKEINPEIEIKTFPEGITTANIEDFLDGVDCYVDSLDFFALDARKMVFDLCAKMHIPATTAAPIGMGTAYLNFLPGQMTFEQYFRLDGYSENEQYLRFFLGLTPAALQKSYLVDPSKLDLANKKGPSTIAGCQLATGVVAAQVAKIFLNRGKVLNVPWGLHYDAYTNQFKKTWRPGGNQNPIQKLAFTFGKKRLLSKLKAPQTNQEPLSLREKVLEYARWAPSGDNTQCWRFRLDQTNQMAFTIEGHDTREKVVYDKDGHASHLAHGMLIETLIIAASAYQLKVTLDQDITDETLIRFYVTLEPDKQVTPSPLVPYIKTRTVQRRAMGTRALTKSEITELEASLPENYQIQWFESFDEKLAIAKLNFVNAKTRLTMKEAFMVHQEIIDWHKQFSETKVPEQALGINWLTARMMQPLFKSWSRMKFVNDYLGGTLLPRIQLDFIPSLKSSAHFAIIAKNRPQSINDYIDAGRAIQRFWLTSAKLGFGFQPEQTPVIFASFLRNAVAFTEDAKVIANANKGKAHYEKIMKYPEQTVFLGRLGRTQTPRSRSLRRPLTDFILKE